MTHQPGLSLRSSELRLSRRGWVGVGPTTRHLAPLAGLLVPALVLLLWQVAVQRAWLPQQILPAPQTVAATFLDLARSGDLTDALRVSLWRIAVGFAAGASAGLLVGTALGLSRRFDIWVGPTIRALAQVPTLGWLPFLILLLGLGESLNLVLIAKASFVPMVVSTSRAIQAIPQATWDVARVLRLRRRTLLLRMLIPAVLPMLFTGLRQALGNAWIALIVVEMLAADAGIGYLIVWGRTLFQIDVVLAGIATIGVIGFAMDVGLRRLERRMRRSGGAHA
jgi:sulfonate transport system permease protein